MKHLMTVSLTVAMALSFHANSQAASLRDQLQAHLTELVAATLDSTTVVNASTINQILNPNNPGPGSTSVIISKSPYSTTPSGHSSVLNASTILQTLNSNSNPSALLAQIKNATPSTFGNNFFNTSASYSPTLNAAFLLQTLNSSSSSSVLLPKAITGASEIIPNHNVDGFSSTASVTALNNAKAQVAAAQQKAQVAVAQQKAQVAVAQQKAQVAVAQQKAQVSFAQQRLASANSLNARYNQVMAAAKAKTGSTSVPSNISASYALALGKLMAKRLVRSLK